MNKSIARSAPNAREIKEIVTDYNAARAGAVSWVRLGFRLLDVKERLPHGGFMKWVDTKLANAANFKHRHLTNAMVVARALCKTAAISPREGVDELNNDASFLMSIVEGNSAHRLLLIAKEINTSEGEVEARNYCERTWKRYPGKRDEWEPRVLGGELTYTLAKAGMLGQETTKGKKRGAVQKVHILEKNVSGLKRHWKAVNEMSSAQRSEFISQLIEALECAPSEIVTGIATHFSK